MGTGCIIPFVENAIWKKKESLIESGKVVSH